MDQQALIEESQLRRAVVAELQGSLLSIRTIEAFLQTLVTRAADHVVADAVCSLTLLFQGRYVTVAGSDERAAVVDGVEYDRDAGPCVEAVHRGVSSVVLDLREDTRWPEWAQTALSLGFLSAAAVPADTGAGAQLALNLYGEAAGQFGESEMRRAFVYVDEAARVVRLCLMLAEQADLAEHVRQAMADCSRIDQALGVLMAQRQISSREALVILRAGARHDCLSLREVATAVIEGGTGHAADGPVTSDPFRLRMAP